MYHSEGPAFPPVPATPVPGRDFSNRWSCGRKFLCEMCGHEVIDVGNVRACTHCGFAACLCSDH